MDNDDLKMLERRLYLAASDDGLWDVLPAAFVAMFALAPLLTARLGDFWSVFVFLPLWAAVYVATRLTRSLLLAPRLGRVRLGGARRARLKRFRVTVVAVNTAALTAGIVAVLGTPASGWWPVVALALVPLALLSLAAYFLEIRRFFAYGLMLAAAAVGGEWLWQEGVASHHGFPVMYGAAAVIIALGGLTRLLLRLRQNTRRHGASYYVHPD